MWLSAYYIERHRQRTFSSSQEVLPDSIIVTHQLRQISSPKHQLYSDFQNIQALVTRKVPLGLLTAVLWSRVEDCWLEP
jgi:hypothetical protein